MLSALLEEFVIKFQLIKNTLHFFCLRLGAEDILDPIVMLGPFSLIYVRLNLVVTFSSPILLIVTDVTVTPLNLEIISDLN